MGWLSTKSPRSAWNKLIFGEKMPDKNDPKYRERYEKEVEAGRKTARFLRLDKAAVALQSFANNNRRTFLAIVFSIVAFVFAFNIWRIATVCGSTSQKRHTATEIQEQRLKERRSVRPLIENTGKQGSDTQESDEQETRHHNQETETDES